MLDRFSQGLPDVQDKEPVAECSHCGVEFYAGNIVYQYCGECYCDAYCLIEAMGVLVVEVHT